MTAAPMFQMSADSRLLLQRLAKASVGETITYEQLSAEIGKKVSGTFGALHRAVHRVRRDYDIVFGTVKGVGVKRLNDSEILSASASDTNAIRRRSKRAVEKLTKADMEKLPQSKQVEYVARVSIFSAMSEMATERTVKKVELAATGSTAKELPISETLRAFGG